MFIHLQVLSGPCLIRKYSSRILPYTKITPNNSHKRSSSACKKHFTYTWRQTWRTEYWPPSNAQSFLKNHINQLPMCFSIFQLPYEKIFSDALKDTFFAHRIYKCSCNSSAKASSSTWLVESRGNINKKRPNPWKKITAKSSKVQSFTNKHPTSQALSMRFLHLSLCPQASKATSSPCSENEPCAVPQQRCSLFWA